jgi:hypothetical protein
MAGPPGQRNDATVADIPAEHVSEELGLMIRIRLMAAFSRSTARGIKSGFCPSRKSVGSSVSHEADDYRFSAGKRVGGTVRRLSAAWRRLDMVLHRSEAYPLGIIAVRVLLQRPVRT